MSEILVGLFENTFEGIIDYFKFIENPIQMIIFQCVESVCNVL